MPLTRATGKDKPYIKVTGLNTANAGPSAINFANLVSGAIVDGDGVEQETFEEFNLGDKPLALEIEAKWVPSRSGLYFVAWNNSKRVCPFTFQRVDANGVAAADNPTISGTLEFPSKGGWAFEASENGSDNFELTCQIRSIDANWNFGV